MLDFGFVSVLPESALVSFDARLVALPVDPGLELILSLVWVQTEGARRGAAPFLLPCATMRRQRRRPP